MPNGEATLEQLEQLYTLEMLRLRARMDAAAHEQKGKRAHKQHKAFIPSFRVGMMRLGELVVKLSGFLLGWMPWIGIFLRSGAKAAEKVIEVERKQADAADRAAALRVEMKEDKAAAQLRKKLGEPVPKTTPHGGGGGWGIPLPGSDFLRPSDQPKELFGIIRVTPQLYRFLFIMGIALMVVGAILVIALTISTFCQGGLQGIFARFVIRLQTGLSLPCP